MTLGGRIAGKYRRALRNQTGATFSLDQLRIMAEYGVLDLLAAKKSEELRSSWSQGSATSDGKTARLSPSPRPQLDRESIKALTKDV